MFHDGSIDGVIFQSLKRYHDTRGWLCELFRQDELSPQFFPVMAYISMTEPSVARGPHEHSDQADYFCFMGPSNFRLFLWDNRRQSPTFERRWSVDVGADNPQAVIVPVGVVHAYKNIGVEPGIVFNCPNRLYRGPGRREAVDEIRHENQEHGPFQLW